VIFWLEATGFDHYELGVIWKLIHKSKGKVWLKIQTGTSIICNLNAKKDFPVLLGVFLHV